MLYSVCIQVQLLLLCHFACLTFAVIHAFERTHTSVGESGNDNGLLVAATYCVAWNNMRVG